MHFDKECLKALRAKYRNTEVRITRELVKILYDRYGAQSHRYDYSEQTLWNCICETVERYQSEQGRMELVYRVDEFEEQVKFLEMDLNRCTDKNQRI